MFLEEAQETINEKDDTLLRLKELMWLMGIQ